MSRTNESSRLSSPVKERYFINGRDGKFSFLQENEGGEATFQDAALPFHFILLDAGGFRAKGEHQKRKVKSTPGHFTKFPVIKLYYDDNGSELQRGQWKELKNIPGIRFVAVLYAAKPDGTMIELHLKGMSYAEFLKFVKNQGGEGSDPAFYFRNDFFTIKALKQVSTDYGKTWVPDFEVRKISKEETKTLADEKDKELQAYLQAYAENQDLNQNSGAEGETHTKDPGYFPTSEPPATDNDADFDPHGEESEPDDDLPF